ncbi:hypothetical protein GCM10022240_16770 [Microbacterium kribbense]|uniref:DUF1254 domain-containing protein n=1 Tax=Microbacterium kribbense TaxID=433645 RepID=A0ABP7GIS1_9MICO
MNRIILRYATPIVIIILLIFAWVISRRLETGRQDVIPLVVAGVIVWVVGTAVFIWFWPRITVGGFKRAILRRGLGGGPIPVNTLYAVPGTATPDSAGGSLMATGAEDLLYVGGWLDLREGAQVLHTPELTGRYYSVQLTDPATSANFAYVGTRATGSAAGDYLLTGPRWTGTVPDGMTRIAAPGTQALVIGRVFAADEADLAEAYALAQQLRLSPLRQR